MQYIYIWMKYKSSLKVYFSGGVAKQNSNKQNTHSTGGIHGRCVCELVVANGTEVALIAFVAC